MIERYGRSQLYDILLDLQVINSMVSKRMIDASEAPFRCKLMVCEEEDQ
jgi:hypothetical protein